ncbi:hypothetical protein [Paenibacillus antibioticophila]|nr:hypothetical protein [Paenibacillus antibioticophila]
MRRQAPAAFLVEELRLAVSVFLAQGAIQVNKKEDHGEATF